MPPPSSTSSLTVRSPEGGLLASPSPAVTTPSTNRCTHCGSVKSPLWRRGIHSEILCNACGLYWKHHGIYRPLSLAAERGGSNSVKIGRGSTFASSTRGYTDSSEATRPSATARSRAEKSSAGVSRKLPPLKAKSSQYAFSSSSATINSLISPTSALSSLSLSASMSVPVMTGTGGNSTSLPIELLLNPQQRPGQSRNSSTSPMSTSTFASPQSTVHLVPAAIYRGDEEQHSDEEALKADDYSKVDDDPSLEASRPPRIKYMMHRGRLLFQGDHVAIRGDDDQIYFGIVSDFWTVEGPGGDARTSQRYFTLRWLLPRPGHAVDIDGIREGLDPSQFILGPEHPQPEVIEAILDVFYSPHLDNHRGILGSSADDAENHHLQQMQRRQKISRKGNQLLIHHKKRHATENSAKAAAPSMEDVEIAHLLCNMS